jgi:hypothetical protein
MWRRRHLDRPTTHIEQNLSASAARAKNRATRQVNNERVKEGVARLATAERTSKHYLKIMETERANM